MKIKARVIAIYLPQYHPIPENDEVWGRGFTEWTNVVQARPLFKGHYQPRIPKDLGFYDLRLPEVREAQAELARNAGIEGFMYWQYYFGKGKMLLERPFEEVLKSGKPDFPFCLGWANHSWQTKTWKKDISQKEGETMIMEQRYDGDQQCIEHFKYNLPAFKDKRYIKINNKPAFFIFNPMEGTEYIKNLIKVWRGMAIENGLEGIHFVGRKKGESTYEDLKNMGFDAIYEERTIDAAEKGTGSKLWWRIRHKLIHDYNMTCFLEKFDFNKIRTSLVSNLGKKNDVYPVLLAGYDRSPRAGRKTLIYYNFTPSSWRNHIKDVLELIKGKPEADRIVMLKSWNEWGESNYVEPDLRYGNEMLDVLKDEIIT